MAKTDPKTDSAKKKKKKADPGATVKIKLKSGKKDGHKSDSRAETGKKAKGDTLEGLSKLVDHPLVADLLAAGAIAAVAAIAEHQMGKGESSSKMVKSVGKAAAAAMGRRLMGDIGAVATAAADAAKKV